MSTGIKEHPTRTFSIIVYIVLLFLTTTIVKSQLPNHSFSIQLSYDKIYYLFNNYPYRQNNGSFIAGIDLSYQIVEKISINSGLGYERKDFIIDYGSSSPFLKREHFDLRYLNIPIIVNYSLLNAFPHFLGIETGVEFGILLDGNRYVDYQNGTSDNNLDDYNLSSVINIYSIGLKYKYLINERMYVALSPRYRRNFTSNQGINGNSGQGTSNSVAVKLGFGFNF